MQLKNNLITAFSFEKVQLSRLFKNAKEDKNGNRWLGPEFSEKDMKELAMEFKNAQLNGHLSAKNIIFNNLIKKT